MKTVELKIGRLGLTPPMSCEKGQSFHIVFYHENGRGTCHTVAFIDPTEDGCNLRTVGDRPWTMDGGVTVEEFMDFAKLAMSLVDKIYEGGE